jgi:hypothetical protein
MNRAVLGRVVALAATLVVAAPAAAIIVPIIVGGGGAASKDCLVVFDVPANFPTTTPKQVRCVDGDTTCDADGTVNGICSVPVRVCANSTFSSACSVSGVAGIDVDHSFDTGHDKKFDPDFLALRQRINQDFTFPVTGTGVCAGTVTFQIPIKGPLGNNHCSRNKKKLKLRSVSQAAAGAITDTDTLKLSCEPAQMNGCDPQTLFPDGTFDRIQKQIFNQSCALGGCHDSQSQTGGLLLESGASYGNLVNHLSSNLSARNAGWLRVTASGMTGDTSTSFLFHKIEGDLPDADYGERMPRGKPKLNGTLREIIRLWIDAGAPQTGWVPGTD